MRWLYAIIGAVWGGLLGIFGSFLIYVVAHFMLSFMFGEPPFPGWVLGLIRASALLAFLVILVSSMATGWRIGLVIDRDPEADKVKARERALNFFVAAVVVNALFVGGITFFATRNIDGPVPQQARQAPAQQQPQTAAGAFERTLHDIVSVDAEDPGTQERFITVAVTLDGARQGKYRLEAALGDRVHNARLVSQHKDFIISPGRQTVRLTLDREEIRNAYRQKVLSGTQNGGKMDLMGDFRLDIRLVPVLSSAEKDALPDYVMNSLSLGKSALIKSREVSLRMALKFQ